MNIYGMGQYQQPWLDLKDCSRGGTGCGLAPGQRALYAVSLGYEACRTDSTGDW